MEELLITLVIVALSALSSWAQKKRRRDEQTEEAKPAGPRPVNPPREAPEPFDWEKELRRLLGGEPEGPVESRPPRPVPPPVPIVATPRSTVPAPLSSPESMADEEAGARAMAPLGESTQAMARAHNLSESVSARFREVHATAERHMPGVVRSKPSQMVSRGSKFSRNLRSPETVREAMLMSFILGRPKALADRD